MSLSVPSEQQAKLLDLDDIDRSVARLRATVKNLSVTLHIDTLTAAVEEIKSRRHDAFVALENIRAELARAESDVELVEKRIATDEKRLQETTSAKDAQGLEHELGTLNERRSNLEDIELAIMESLEEAQQNYDGLGVELASAEAALDEAKSQENLESSRLTAEIQSLNSSRVELVASLPGELVALYERQRERYGLGASHLRGGVSGASGVALTEADLQTIRNAPADEVLLCPDSNAILIRTGESGL
jgi:uncharacterized protein